MNDANTPIPVICLDMSSIEAYHVFNPNDWQGATRGVIQSCATEFSVLLHSASRIAGLCSSAKELCRHHFDTLKLQWQRPPSDLSRVVCYGQVPEMHVLIEGFFAGLKSLLDLNAQLLSTQRIVSVRLDGFHRDKGILGGSVLNALDNNATSARKIVAASIKSLIIKHKGTWIDEAIQSRDQLVHPVLGVQQLMFEIAFEQQDGSLAYVGAHPPYIGESRIDQYAAARLESIRQFSIAH